MAERSLTCGHEYHLAVDDLCRNNQDLDKRLFDAKRHDIRSLQSGVVMWANDRFPGRSIKTAITKLKEEVAELEKKPTPSEIADCLILLLDIAYLRNCQPTKIIRDKMEVNRGRKWAKNPKTGAYDHIRRIKKARNRHDAAPPGSRK